MAEQNNVYQLKRLLAKMTGKQINQIDAYTIADVLAQICDGYNGGGSGGSSIAAMTLNVNGEMGIDNGEIRLTTGEVIEVTISQIEALTLTSVEGSAIKKTVVTVAEPLTANCHYRILVSSSNEVMPAPKQDLSGWAEWNGTDEITAQSGHKLKVAECDANNRAVRCGECNVVAPIF